MKPEQIHTSIEDEKNSQELFQAELMMSIVKETNITSPRNFGKDINKLMEVNGYPPINIPHEIQSRLVYETVTKIIDENKEDDIKMKIGLTLSKSKPSRRPKQAGHSSQSERGGDPRSGKHS